MKQALVLGYGKSGKAIALYLAMQGVAVVVYDDHCKIESLEQATLDDLDHFVLDIAVISPGFPNSHPAVQKLRKKGVVITSEASLCMPKIKQPLVGITGTNGKTTLTYLIAHILGNAATIGNVGTPFAEFLFHERKEKYAVAELSSYQLETLESKVLDCAIYHNLTPDHLDRYESLEAYGKAKSRIGDIVKEGGEYFVNEKIVEAFPQFFVSIPPIKYGMKERGVFFTDDNKEKIEYIFPLRYREMSGIDQMNAFVALLVCRKWGVSEETFWDRYRTFIRPPHRIEFVASIDGVSYYNDSKGTNVDAVIQAVSSMKGPVYLIAGGVDKGGDFKVWIDHFRGKVQRIFTLGMAAEKIETQLGIEFAIQQVESLKEAIEKASFLAKKGDVILLSPGCASFDLFKNYAERGDIFKQLVAERSKKQ